MGALINGTDKVFKVAKVRRAVDQGGGITGASPWEEVALAPMFERVRVLSFIRNQVGAHFNVAGLSLSDADVEEFGRSALGLALAIRCPRCGQVPSGDRGTHRGCRCRKHQTQLVPLTVR